MTVDELMIKTKVELPVGLLDLIRDEHGQQCDFTEVILIALSVRYGYGKKKEKAKPRQVRGIGSQQTQAFRAAMKAKNLELIGLTGRGKPILPRDGEPKTCFYCDLVLNRLTEYPRVHLIRVNNTKNTNPPYTQFCCPAHTQIIRLTQQENEEANRPCRQLED